jgi:hypothetical protein
MIFDVTGDILADGSQLKHLVFDGRIVCLLGELPIHVGLIPEIIRPIHGRALGLHQPERELTISTASKAGDEVSDVFGDTDAFDVAAGLNFETDLFRDILRPMLKRIEGDNADRVVELSRYQIGDDGFDVRSLDLGFALNRAKTGKAVNHEVDRLICTVGHHPWCPGCSRHPATPRRSTKYGEFSTKAEIVPAQK